MNKKPSQADKILKYLQSHKRGLTPIEALQKFGCFRLSARIWELRDRGYDIRTDNVKKEDGDGRYARYFMVEGN